VSKSLISILGVLALVAVLPGCRVIKNHPGGAAANAAAGNGAPTAESRAEGMWDSRIVPYAQKKAAPYPQLAGLLSSSSDQAVREHGFRADTAGAKAVLFTRIEGTIVAADTKSRAGTIEVDTDGDGKSDVTVQIGPIVRGNALRDSLDFVSFNSFANQIDYADFSKALNTHVRNAVLKGVPRDGLVGKHVSLLGAFFLVPGSVPVITPITCVVGDKAK